MKKSKGTSVAYENSKHTGIKCLDYKLLIQQPHWVKQSFNNKIHNQQYHWGYSGVTYIALYLGKSTLAKLTQGTLSTYAQYLSTKQVQ